LTADGNLLLTGGLSFNNWVYDDAYTLTVDGIHTYFVQVADADVLVHNCTWPKPTADNCEACALQIQEQIGGEITRITPTGGPAFGRSANNADGNWAFHDVVVKDGRV